MRMIEQEIIQAIRDRKSFSTSYTQDMYRKKEGHRDVLQWSEYDTFLYLLWGHAIAEGDTVTNNLTVSDCGYATATTVSRLNAVFAALDIPMSCAVKNKKTVYFLYGNPVNENVISAGDWKVKVI